MKEIVWWSQVARRPRITPGTWSTSSKMIHSGVLSEGPSLIFTTLLDIYLFIPYLTEQYGWTSPASRNCCQYHTGCALPPWPGPPDLRVPCSSVLRTWGDWFQWEAGHNLEYWVVVAQVRPGDVCGMYDSKPLLSQSSFPTDFCVQQCSNSVSFQVSLPAGIWERSIPWFFEFPWSLPLWPRRVLHNWWQDKDGTGKFFEECEYSSCSGLLLISMSL